MKTIIALVLLTLSACGTEGMTDGIPGTGGTSNATGGQTASAGAGGTAGAAGGVSGQGGVLATGGSGGAAGMAVGGASPYPSDAVWLEIRYDSGVSSRGGPRGSCLAVSTCADFTAAPIEVRNMGGLATDPLSVFVASQSTEPAWVYQFKEWGTVKLLTETCSGKAMNQGESCTVQMHACPTTPDKPVYLWACGVRKDPRTEEMVFGVCERLPLQCP